MARGQRVNLAELHTVVGDRSPVENGQHQREDATACTAALTDLIANPRNPRRSSAISPTSHPSQICNCSPPPW